MKSYSLAHVGLACLLITLGNTGCQTGENSPGGFSRSVKTQGVYTTLALTNDFLDLPDSGYLKKSSFGPGETPAAVIVGYGGHNQPQLAVLELRESSTGRSLFSRDNYLNYGKARVHPLAIRLSGNYELKLMTGGTELDSWQFTVTRTNSSGIMQVENANAGAKYAQGNVAVSVSGSRGFAKYNEKLNFSIVNAMGNATGSTNRVLFVQRFPGKVVIQCRLDFQGRITEPKILENTLAPECGDVFQKALLDRSPYDAWPEDIHQQFGSDDRYLTLTIYFN